LLQVLIIASSATLLHSS